MNINLSEYIIYEDNHLLIFNKQPSMIVQGDKTGDMPLSELLKAFIKKRDNKPGHVFLGVVHRLDRPVSGAVIFAKTSKALTRLNEMLKKREIQKRYLAIVSNCPKETEGTLKNYLIKDEKHNFVKVFDEEVSGSQYAELNYKLVGKSKTFYILNINLITGRSHQIRSQLSHIGCPIAGDNKYGYKRANPDRSICLHSHTIDFVHPVSKKEINIIAPFPKNNKIWEIINGNSDI